MDHKISILVPVYGVEQYIEKCARSLFEQDYENIEFVFVNDCTIDRSEEVLLALIEHYPNRKGQIKIVRHEKNRGLVATRKTALANATGKFVMWVDSDDWIEPGSVKALIEKQEETNADIVSGSVWQITHTGKNVLITPEYQTREGMLEEILKYNSYHICVWGKIIRLSLYEQFDIVTKDDCVYCEDWWVTSQIAYYASSAASIPGFVYNYNCTNESSMVELCHRHLKVDYWKQAVESCSFLVGFFKDKEPRWNEAAHKKSIQHLRNYYLHFAAEYAKPELYSEILSFIQTEYHDYYSVIGWDNPVKRRFESNYRLLSLFLRTRSFVNTQVKKVFKRE